ncbi:MAG: hypothetical protein AAFW70_14450 [Cyanobacteria bacterium J06635_10]
MFQVQIDKLIQIAVNCCHRRNPELLDEIFDDLPVEINKQILIGTVAVLHGDIDSTAWLCGYFQGQ